jgi:hypothetical protein
MSETIVWEIDEPMMGGVSRVVEFDEMLRKAGLNRLGDGRIVDPDNGAAVGRWSTEEKSPED